MSAPHVGVTSEVRKDYVDRLIANDEQTKGCLLMFFPFTFADAATNSKDVVMKDKVEVLDVVVQKRAGAGAAGNTVRVTNGTGANHITDAIDTNDADQILSRPTTVDDAFSTLNPGDTLRVTNTKSGGNSACRVIVVCALLA